MDFDSHEPIYLQICDQIFEKILREKLKPDDRVSSVREFGTELGVNPNTVMRSYEHLQNAGVIYNKRGIGYFISKNAKDIILKEQKEQFLKEELPVILKKMKLFGITREEFVKLYDTI